MDVENNKENNKKLTLEKNLTVLDGWAIGTGAMVGVTIFVVSGLMAGEAGPAGSLSFLIAALVTLIIALSFCEVSSALPIAGGIYVYPRETLGKIGNFVSFISGWGFYGGQGLGPAIVALSCSYYINWTLELVGIAKLNELSTAVIIIAIICVLNVIGTDWGSRLQLISTLIIAGALLLFIAAGAFNVDTINYQPFFPFGFKGVLKAAAIGWLTYGGWSAIPSMSEEFRNPSTDVPYSMVLSLITCGLLFTFIVLVMTGLIPFAELAKEQAPLAAAAYTFSKYCAILIVFGGVFACISTLNGLMMTGARVVYSMGRDGDLPSIISRIHPRFKTPYIAIIVTALGQIFLACTGLFSLLVEMIVFVTAISWITTCICLFAIRKNRTDLKPSFRVPFYPVTPVLGIILAIIMISQLQTMSITVGIAWILIGILLYLLLHYTGLKKYCVER